MLPPYELKNKDFSKVMRGYNPAEVDEHISFIIEKYTELYRENDELERKLKTAYAKLDEIQSEEESIRSAMVNAQRASSKIMNEANDRADIIINTARKSCDRILADFKSKIQEEKAVLMALNSAVSDFKERLFKAYNSHISFIEEIKLPDENEIAKYVMPDENYTSAVIQNIKQDIINMSNEVKEEAKNEDVGFVRAEVVTPDTVIRSNSVKDTIKELNKRFLDEEPDNETTASAETVEVQEIAAPVVEQPVEKSAEETEAEREYAELLKQLGVPGGLDLENFTQDEDEGNSSVNDRADGFNQAYKTPKDYDKLIRKKKKLK